MAERDTSQMINPTAQPQSDGNDPLTYAVIGAAMQVHTELGPGLDEAFYHKLLTVRLHAKGIAHQSKPKGELLHREIKADVFECDFLGQDRLITELKVLSGPDTFAPEHFAQLICYLKFWRVATGLLLDFGKERLIYRRVAFTNKCSLPVNAAEIMELSSAGIAWREIAGPVFESIARVYQAHGLGYRDTTYEGLVSADLLAENTPFITRPVIPIQSERKHLGDARCNCFVIGGAVALLILALRDQISTTDRAILQTYLKHLGLQGGLIVNFGKHRLDVVFVSLPKVCSPAL